MPSLDGQGTESGETAQAEGGATATGAGDGLRHRRKRDKHRCHDLAFLHRSSHLCHGAVDRHHLDGRDRAVEPADRAIPADHAARRLRLDHLSGGQRQIVADTVAAPIEQQVNGVEGMLYMSSQSGNDGSYTLTVTFDVGTDLNTALGHGAEPRDAGDAACCPRRSRTKGSRSASGRPTS